MRVRLARGAGGGGAAGVAVEVAAASLGGEPSASVLGAAVEGRRVSVSPRLAFLLRGFSFEGAVKLYFVVMRVWLSHWYIVWVDAEERGRVGRTEVG